MPIRPQEIDQDSEGENDPEWLKQKSMNVCHKFDPFFNKKIIFYKLLQNLYKIIENQNSSIQV